MDATTPAPAALDYPAANGRTVTEGHARVCRERGHATYVRDGVDQGTCPRCGEVTTPAVTAAPAPAAQPTAFYFDGKPELRTSYANQRGIAARNLGHQVKCIHGATLADGCNDCRRCGTPLVPAL